MLKNHEVALNWKYLKEMKRSDTSSFSLRGMESDTIVGTNDMLIYLGYCIYST